MSVPACQIQDLSVRFGAVRAVRKVSLDLQPGEIHAIVGENGAGKSTLMHALVGLVRPESGRVLVEGKVLVPAHPKSARRAGIAMVFQRFRLVPALTVAENAVLGLDGEPRFVRAAALMDRVHNWSQRLELDLDPRMRVADLDEGARQRVEILRMFMQGARMLILDEPTSVLSPFEAERLLFWLRRRADEGTSIFLVSHKLNEVLSVADRVTVMRQGAVAGESVPAAKTSAKDLVRQMVGEESPTTPDVPVRTMPMPPEDEAPRLHLADVSWSGPLTRERLDGVTLSLHAGRITGVAGVSGNGQSALAWVCTGMVQPLAGTVTALGRDLTNRGPIDFLEAKVRYVPEERDHVAVARSLSLIHNVFLRGHPLLNGIAAWWMPRGAMTTVTRDLVAAADVRTPGLDVPVRTLSGGNLQKLILARETMLTPRVLVVCQPTQGLDVGATARVHAILRHLRATGTAILLISADLDEVLGLSDAVVVMYRGRLRHLSPDAINRENVGRAMAGVIG